MMSNKKIIVYAPTASGKSVLAAFMTHNSVKKGYKTLILTHREEILNQNFHKMDMLGIDVQIINAKTREIREAQVYCAMSQTVTSRCKRLPEWTEWLSSIDFVIVDEVHRAEHDAIYKHFKESVWIVGLSASILRSGATRQLGMVFSKIVAPILAQELIELRYLTPSKNYAFQAPVLDTVVVSYTTGDYAQKQLQSVFTKPERYAGIISNYQRICPGTKAIVFTTGSEHCIELCKSFCDAGIKAKYLLSGKYPDTHNKYSGGRKDVLRGISTGEFDVLVSVDMMTTGLDIPSLETVILDFSTKSYTKYVQCVGRGARIYPNKTHFNVLDFGANISSYGIAEATPLLSLWHNVGGHGVPMTKECPATKKDSNGKSGCGRLIPISAQDCVFCGYHFATEKEIYEVELKEVIAQEQDDIITIPGYVAAMMLQGKSANYILVNICIKNPDNPKQAFMEAIKYIRIKNGQRMSPKYWYFFKKNVLRNKLQKKPLEREAI